MANMTRLSVKGAVSAASRRSAHIQQLFRYATLAAAQAPAQPSQNNFFHELSGLATANRKVAPQPTFDHVFGGLAPRVSYLETCGLGDSQLPLPHDHLDAIGNTPLVEVQRGMYAKLEGHNPGDSLKDRTITSIVMNSFHEGTLALRNDTLVLVTSGSAGVSLVALHQALASVEGLDLNVIVVMPKAYAHKKIPSEIIDHDSTEVFHGHTNLIEHNRASGFMENRCQVMLMDGAFIDILAETREIAAEKGWKMLEQHTDCNSVQGHASTAIELMQAVPDLTDVVCSTGTGATAAGLRKFLPDHVTVHSRPAESGTIDGLSNVRRYNNFCNPEQLANYDSCLFDKDTAERHTEALLDQHGIKAGPSSGACFWLAREVMDEHEAAGKVGGKDAKVVFICADGSMEGLSQPQVCA